MGDYVNKIIIDGETVLDLTNDTVVADKLAQGYTAHDKSGNSIVGTMQIGGTSIHNDLTGRDAANAHPMSAITDLVSTLSGKVDDYSISINAPTGGNPRNIKFLTVDYNGTDSNNAIFITLKAISCHPNGTSYKFMEDITIGVSYVGDVGVDVQKSIRTTCGTVDGAERFYGDVFYTVDTTAKIVDFFILGGQYASVMFTPYKRRNKVSGGTITQYSGTATYYSSGTKVYGNNDLIATLGNIPTKTSDLTNDSGFANDSAVVHKTGNETVAGIKTFDDNTFFNGTATWANCDPNFISQFMYGMYQWDNMLQFTKRNTSNGYINEAWHIQLDTEQTVFNYATSFASRPTVGGVQVALTSDIPTTYTGW